jgi:uncharacterized MAPEG superfamily protein
MQAIEMTIPLWGLCVFIIWMMLLVVLLIIVRLQHLRSGGSPEDFGNPTGNKLLWRVFRAQANCAENLPLYVGTILLLEVRGIANEAIDLFVIIYIGSRLLHSLIHILGFNPNFRVVCLGVQFASLLGLIFSGVA